MTFQEDHILKREVSLAIFQSDFMIASIAMASLIEELTSFVCAEKKHERGLFHGHKYWKLSFWEGFERFKISSQELGVGRV